MTMPLSSGMQTCKQQGFASHLHCAGWPLVAGRRRRVEINSFYRRYTSVTTRPAQTPPQQPEQQRTSGHSAPGIGKGKGLRPFQTKNGKNVFAGSRSVKFHVRYKCEYGQEVYLVGNCTALGDWDVMKGVQLVWSTGHVWEGSVELPAGMHIQYKYVVRNKDGSVVRWQEGANVSLDLPGGNADELALDVEDSWNKSKQVKRILASGTPVRFNIRVRTEFGQQLRVVGGCPTLGAWNIDNSVKLNWQEGHIWETGVELPAGELVEYKYVVLNADGSVDRWQPGDNLKMEVPVAQGNNGRRRGVLVLDTWVKATSSNKARRPPRSTPAGSWRSTPHSSMPANSGSSVDVNDASSAAARSYYSMMNGAGSRAASSSVSTSSTDNIYDPVHSHQPDPSVMQLWTDKPRFSSGTHTAQYSADHQQHHDPWRQQERQQQQQQEPRIFVPAPPAGASTEEHARWQALQSVMAALQHSSELDHWVDDPTDPRMLAADRRLAALTASLGSDSSAAMAAAMV